MVPVDTCYRMLDMFCWVFAVTGTLASVTVTTINHGMLLHNPIYYAVLAAIIANWVVTIFRGLPFLVRYMTFAIGFSILELGPTLGLGIIPNMALILLVLVTSVALFFGTAKAMWAVGVFFVVHMAIAWGWVNGSMPIFINRKEDLSAYMDMTSPRVWFRVMITASGLIMTVLYMMRFMLHDTRRALHGAEQALQRLAVEQDGRERAERAARERFRLGMEIIDAAEDAHAVQIAFKAGARIDMGLVERTIAMGHQLDLDSSYLKSRNA